MYLLIYATSPYGARYLSVRRSIEATHCAEALTEALFGWLP